MKTDQFLLRLNVELIGKLKALAEKYGKSSGQQVAVEIIEQYVDFWEEAEEAKQEVIRRQRETLEIRLKEANGSKGKGASKKKVQASRR